MQRSFAQPNSNKIFHPTPAHGKVPCLVDRSPSQMLPQVNSETTTATTANETPAMVPSLKFDLPTTRPQSDSLAAGAGHPWRARCQEHGLTSHSASRLPVTDEADAKETKSFPVDDDTYIAPF